MPTAPKSIKKKGDLTNAAPNPDIPAQSQGTGTVPRQPETRPAQATTNGNASPTTSKPKK